MEANAFEYQTVQETAEAWGVTKRYVNLCIADGRVSGVVKMGKMWLVPKGVSKPAGPRPLAQAMQKSLSSDLIGIVAATTAPMPCANPDAVLDTVSEERLRLQYEGELAYLRGDFDCTKRCFHKTEGDEAARLRASSVAIAAAISLGDYPFYMEIETFLKGFMKTNASDELSAFAELCLACAHVSAIAPNMVPCWLKDGDFSALPHQARPDAAYKRAKYFQCLGQFESMLAVARTALEFCASKREISFQDIYFRIVCAMACCGLGHADEAKRYLLDAMNIALPHGFITPFAESATAFGGLLEPLLKQEFPAYYDSVMKQWKRTFTNWLTFHNRFTKDNITLILSLREYEIAQFVARRVPYAKVAEQLHLSPGSLKNAMQVIYGKLFVNNRSELSKLIL